MGAENRTPVRVSRCAHVPVSSVWECIADPYAYAQWVAGTASVDAADPDWPAAGARLFHRFGPWPVRVRDHTQVLECRPQYRIVLRASARPWAVVRAEVTLIPNESGVQVVICEEIAAGLAARCGAISRWVQLWRNRRSLDDLVRLAERRSR